MIQCRFTPAFIVKGNKMADWKDRLDEELETTRQQIQRYTVVLPQVAAQEFHRLRGMLESDAAVLTEKHGARIGRIDVAKEEPNKIRIEKYDFPAYYVTLELPSEAKQICVEREVRYSPSQSRTFRTIFLELDLDSRNNLLIRHDGKTLRLEEIAEMLLKPIVMGTDFER